MCGECEERKWKREILTSARDFLMISYWHCLHSVFFYNNMCWPKNSPKMCTEQQQKSRGITTRRRKWILCQNILVFYTFSSCSSVMRSHTHVNHKYFNENYRDSPSLYSSYRRKCRAIAAATRNDSRKEFFLI